MADLGELVGTLLASLAHARRMADEETAAIAEYYKSNPLLEGMSVPRIRVPELSLELPILIESIEEGEADQPREINPIVDHLKETLNRSAGKDGIAVRSASYREFRAAFEKHLRRQLERMSPAASVDAKRFPPEAVARAADEAFMRARRDEERARVRAARDPDVELEPLVFTAEQVSEARADIRRAANDVALKSEGTRPRINAEIMTAHVKERADAGSVARLKIVMREEGLEWTISESGEGAITKTLTPE